MASLMKSGVIMGVRITGFLLQAKRSYIQ